jgi:hypothetical protein
MGRCNVWRNLSEVLLGLGEEQEQMGKCNVWRNLSEVSFGLGEE